MRKRAITTAIIGSLILFAVQINSCKVSEEILAKSGAQLWAENCNRCHNIPSPSDYSDSEWSVVGTHMRVRANLTAVEANKIMEFLKTAN